MSEPSLQLALYLDVHIGVGLERGTSADGKRIDYPILGGRFAGPGLLGEIPPGGADHYLEQWDGNGLLDARYSLRCDDGALIEVHNRGLLTFSGAGLELARSSWPIPEQHYQCRCAPQFRTEHPRYQWLMRHLFIGTVTYPAENAVRIACFRVD